MKNTPRLIPVTFTILSLICTSAPAQLKQVQRVSTVENPSGVLVGFWPNYTSREELTVDLGRRPVIRLGFYSWSRLENTKGRYDFSAAIKEIKQGNQCGSRVITSLNVISTAEINKEAVETIPKFYPQRITNPETRDAALKLVHAFVQDVLKETGSIMLSLDYELFWNYLPATDALRKEYHDWFLEAVAVARKAAADLGMSRNLMILPIVNGDPIDSNGRFLGAPASLEKHIPQPWLKEIVEASDALGMDMYELDKTRRQSARYTLDIIRFWVKYYSCGKPVYVTESGFSTVWSVNPSFPDGYHARGTEADQAAYYEDMLDTLYAWNENPKIFNHQLRMFCFWMYRDFKVPTDGKNEMEQYFGLLRPDGTPKSAWYAVKKRLDRFENDPATCPYKITSEEAVCFSNSTVRAVELSSGAGLEQNQFLRCQLDSSAGKTPLQLTVETEEPSTVLIRFNESGKWAFLSDLSRSHSLKLNGYLTDYAGNSFQLWLSGSKIPFTHKIKQLSIEQSLK